MTDKPKNADKKKIALNLIKAVDNMRDAKHAAEEAGLQIEMIQTSNGERTDISKAIISVRIFDEIWPVKERPGY